MVIAQRCCLFAVIVYDGYVRIWNSFGDWLYFVPRLWFSSKILALKRKDIYMACPFEMLDRLWRKVTCSVSILNLSWFVRMLESCSGFVAEGFLIWLKSWVCCPVNMPYACSNQVSSSCIFAAYFLRWLHLWVCWEEVNVYVQKLKFLALIFDCRSW